MISVRIAGGWLYAMRRVLATICIGVLAVSVGYKVVVGANGMKVWQAKRAEVERLQKEIDEANDKNQQLQHEVDALQRAEPSVIEREAREQLGYVKPGEVILVQPQPKPDSKTPAVAESVKPQEAR